VNDHGASPDAIATSETSIRAAIAREEAKIDRFYIGEGFDDARLDTLFLAMPISWKGTLIQYTGRLYRLHPGKTEVRIYDYVDREVPILDRMFQKRLRGYRAIGYGRGMTPVGHDEANENAPSSFNAPE
jgi:hypothetical protein